MDVEKSPNLQHVNRHSNPQGAATNARLYVLQHHGASLTILLSLMNGEQASGLRLHEQRTAVGLPPQVTLLPALTMASFKSVSALCRAVPAVRARGVAVAGPLPLCAAAPAAVSAASPWLAPVGTGRWVSTSAPLRKKFDITEDAFDPFKKRDDHAYTTTNAK